MDYEIQGQLNGDEWERVNTEVGLKDARRSLREYRENDPGHPYRMRSVVPNEKVAAWADGYGRWHARITFDGEYTDEDVSVHMARLRAKARRAIRRELEAREAVGAGWRCRVTIAERQPTSIEFHEGPLLP